MLGCENPLRSVAVSLGSGGLAGVVGLLGDLSIASVIMLAGGVALVSELASHTFRNDADGGQRRHQRG